VISGTPADPVALVSAGTAKGGARYLPPTVIVVLVAGVLVVGGLVGPALAKDGRLREQGDDPLAVSLLHRAMSASDRVSYNGTQYVSAWSALDRSVSTSAVVDVRHVAGVETVVTGNDATRVVLPAGHGDSWLGGSGGPIGLLLQAYDVRLVTTGQVAGRPVDVVAAYRPDGSAAAQLWLDAEHALPLRREVYDEYGRTVSASSFVDISVVSVNPFRRPVNKTATTAGRASTAPTALSHDDLTRLRSRGWLCPTTLDGGLVLYEAQRHGGAVQLSYSDGVTTLSVFEQPGRLNPGTLDGFTEHRLHGGAVYAAPGPPSQFVWSTESDRMITVVADGSLSGVDAVAAAFPPSELSSPDGLVERIGRGAKRLVGWLNPFD
jgi:MucB/RseB N-terminal domain